MKGSQLNDWRTVQIFISPTGVHEVQLRPDSDEPRCNCASYKIRNSCKHTKFIQARMAENDGHYAILVPENVPDAPVMLPLNVPDVAVICPFAAIFKTLFAVPPV